MELFLALISHTLKQVSLTLGKCIFNFNTSLPLLNIFIPNIRKMTTLLQIASKVEAAMKAYITVQDFADKEEWKEKFQGEMVSSHLQYMAFRSLINSNRKMQLLNFSAFETRGVLPFPCT